MDEAMRRRVCSLVAGVLLADDKMDRAENDFLKRVLAKFELDPDTGLMPVQGADMVSEFAELPEPTRWETLYLLIKAAAIDGVIDPRERAMIDMVARYLGVDERDVVEQLQRVLRSAPVNP